MEVISHKLVLVALLLVITIAGNGVIFQASNAQSVLCNMSGAGLMACKPSVTTPNPTAPSVPCCKALSQADIGCLCSYKHSKVLPSLGIDPALAMQLPEKCKLPHPANC